MKRIAAMTFSLVTMVGVAAFAADSPTKLSGWISDSMCGAKHAGTGASCAKKCVDGGSKAVFVDEKKEVWAIDNPEVVKDDVGKHVAIMATPDAATKSVHVASVSVIAE